MSLDPYGFSDAAPAEAGPDRPFTRWWTTVTVPIIAMLFGTAYYLTRSQQWFLGRDAGIEADTLSHLGQIGAVAGLVFGIALAAAVGGAVAMVAGLLLWIVGAGLMAGGSLEAGVVLTALSRYTFNVGASAALARGPRREGTLLAMFALLYVGINLGALFTTAGWWVADRMGPHMVLGGAGAIAVVALFIALPLPALHLLRPPPTPERAARGLAPDTLMWAGITTVIVVIVYTAWSLGMDFQAQLGATSGSWDLYSFRLLNPLVVIACGTLLAAVVGGLGLAGIQVPSLAVAAVGSLLLGAGLLPSILAGGPGTALVLLFGQLLAGLGEPLFFAGVQARLTGPVHWRVAAVGAAVLSACGVGAMLVHDLVPEATYGVFTTTAGGVAIVGALAFGAVAWFARRTPPETSVQPPAPAP